MNLRSSLAALLIACGAEKEPSGTFSLEGVSSTFMCSDCPGLEGVSLSFSRERHSQMSVSDESASFGGGQGHASWDGHELALSVDFPADDGLRLAAPKGVACAGTFSLSALLRRNGQGLQGTFSASLMISGCGCPSATLCQADGTLSAIPE